MSRWNYLSNEWNQYLKLLRSVSKKLTNIRTERHSFQHTIAPKVLDKFLQKAKSMPRRFVLTGDLRKTLEIREIQPSNNRTRKSENWWKEKFRFIRNGRSCNNHTILPTGRVQKILLVKAKSIILQLIIGKVASSEIDLYLSE